MGTTFGLAVIPTYGVVQSNNSYTLVNADGSTTKYDGAPIQRGDSTVPNWYYQEYRADGKYASFTLADIAGQFSIEQTTKTGDITWTRSAPLPAGTTYTYVPAVLQISQNKSTYDDSWVWWLIGIVLVIALIVVVVLLMTVMDMRNKVLCITLVSPTALTV